MAHHMSRIEVLDAYGFGADPFDGALRSTEDSRRVSRLIRMAIKGNKMVSLIARRGQGKTTALQLAFEGVSCHVVQVETPDRERVLVSDIEKAIILALGNGEACRRGKVVRSLQIKRILGERVKERPVVLVLEEAHRIHAQTIRSLKTFRELRAGGVSPLFTVVFVGQHDPMAKAGVSEVRLRSDAIHMHGLSAGEIEAYIGDTVGEHFAQDAVEAMGRVDRASNYLDLQEMIYSLLYRALVTGTRKVGLADVFELCGGGIAQLMKELGVSNSDLATELNIPRGTVSLVVQGRQGTLSESTYRQTRETISAFLRSRKQAGAQAAERTGTEG